MVYIHAMGQGQVGQVTASNIGIRKIASEMKALKCKPSAQFVYNYSINVLSKCSNNFTSIFEGRHIDHRSSKVNTSIFEGRHIHHPSLKVDTSMLKGQHIDLRKSTSIFEGR